MQKPVPYVTAESSEYWEGCRNGKLLYQFCLNCGWNQFYPRFQCKQCGSKELEFRESKGTGVISTFTVVYRAPSPAFKVDTPYVVAIVNVDEGFSMMTNIVGEDQEVKIGDRVMVEFEQRSEEMVIPQFRKMLTFEQLEIGKVYGEELYECSAEKVTKWMEIYSGISSNHANNQVVPAGMSGVIVMNTYDEALKGRPPGNVHGSQTFQYHRGIQVGERVTTSLSIEDKTISNGRKWVTIKTETSSESGGLLLEGRMKILWAE